MEGMLPMLLHPEKEHMRTPHPEIVDAIRCIRAEGIKTAVLTNNWKWSEDSGSLLTIYPALFDEVLLHCYVFDIRLPYALMREH